MLAVALIVVITVLATWPGALERLEALAPKPRRGLYLHGKRSVHRLLDDLRRRYPSQPG